MELIHSGALYFNIIFNIRKYYYPKVAEAKKQELIVQICLDAVHGQYTVPVAIITTLSVITYLVNEHLFPLYRYDL